MKTGVLGNLDLVTGDRRTFSACAESIPAVRASAVDWARAQGATGDTLHSIALAVTEAATNVVVHAYRDLDRVGEIHLDVVQDDEGLCVSICDDGHGMAPRPDSPGLGLGMPLIANVADRLEVHTSDAGGTELRMRFGLRVLCKSA